MKDLIGESGINQTDLSKRMAENVIEATVTYLSAPGLATAEQVTVLSAALQSLATLAIAEQLQALAIALEPDSGDGHAADEGEYSYWPGDPLIEEIRQRRNGGAA